MKKRIFLVSFLLVNLSVFGQEVIATQGDSYSNSSGNIDYTIGETITFTGTDGTNDITQGFHQTNWNFLGLDDFSPELSLTVFPNPTSDRLNIESASYEGLNVVMTDEAGRIVLTESLKSENTSFDVSEFSTGSYHLIIQSNGQILKDFRIVKHQ